ncbi:hypothetical protein [Mycobacteroides abscessus]|uniref:Transmembrane protein n=1 Tax=Mycobacteroides abscessus TaxID=36809 RepID=A0A0U0ZQU7_9MYCO|nr:hypothetical protein [Mycobacteroides abscessus]CPV66032.1 Uncharacterised protein [Mycobacteroides abscessus]
MPNPHLIALHLTPEDFFLAVLATLLMIAMYKLLRPLYSTGRSAMAAFWDATDNNDVTLIDMTSTRQLWRLVAISVSVLFLAWSVTGANLVLGDAAFYASWYRHTIDSWPDLAFTITVALASVLWGALMFMTAGAAVLATLTTAKWVLTADDQELLPEKISMRVRQVRNLGDRLASRRAARTLNT